jgi:hypothetical protein
MLVPNVSSEPPQKDRCQQRILHLLLSKWQRLGTRYATALSINRIFIRMQAERCLNCFPMQHEQVFSLTETSTFLEIYSVRFWSRWSRSVCCTDDYMTSLGLNATCGLWKFRVRSRQQVTLTTMSFTKWHPTVLHVVTTVSKKHNAPIFGMHYGNFLRTAVTKYKKKSTPRSTQSELSRPWKPQIPNDKYCSS